MPNVQPSYPNNIPAGPAGFVSDMRQAVFASYDVEPANLGFGLPVFQGTADKQCRLFAANDTVTDFLGVTVLDRAARGADGNSYAQRESARVLQEGPIRVQASVQVAAGDPVAVTSAGVWSNVAGAGGVVIPGARWDTSTTGVNQVARISLR